MTATGPLPALSAQSSKLRCRHLRGEEECLKAAQPPAQDLPGLCSRALHVPSRPQKEICTRGSWGSCLPPSTWTPWLANGTLQAKPASIQGGGRMESGQGSSFDPPQWCERSRQEDPGSFVEGHPALPSGPGGDWLLLASSPGKKLRPTSRPGLT